jgi:hypothetical protein
MKHYLLAMHHPGTDGAQPPREILDKVMRAVGVIREDMKAAGAWVFAGGLQPPNMGTVLQIRDHKVFTTDGPFTESKEHIGGVTIIRVADLDVALEWARKLVEATGLPIEVRPFREPYAVVG